MTSAEATSFPIFAAAVEPEKPPAVVSIHDVAPSTRATCEKIITELGRRGVNVCSLLVVPDYHHGGSAMRDRSFVQWLRDLQSAGYEVVIHGYFHARPRRGGESLRERLTTRIYTANEGEFFDLDYAEAFRRVSQARDEFRAAGLTPRGFIAPAWLLGAEAQRAVADAELEYTTRLTNVRDLRTGDEFHSRSLVYSVRSGWRRVASIGWNGTLAQLLIASKLLRLAIHPPDALHERVWRQICAITQSIAETRTPTTYRNWIAERRLQARRNA